ncbi:integrase core domain-containing protein [Alkalicoccus luteus]|uniref:integrase core domain-containing protein n=1 Tax=Alkalicoccus luteus TaxID=1237094 RepID=UPI004033E695
MGQHLWLQKMGGLLRRDFDLVINKKKVYRLCQELGILKEQRHKKPPYPRHLARVRVITAPNQLWQMDLKYGIIAESGRFFFICNVIDVFDRTIVGYYRGPECRWMQIRQMLVKTFMHQHHNYYESIPQKSPNLNAYVEAFHSHLHQECFDQCVFTFFDEAYAEVDAYYAYYNAKRPHGSLHFMTPAAYHEEAMKGEVAPIEMKVR